MLKENIQAIKGFIFDLDGTLLTSTLNFQAIKAQIKCPPTEDILSYISRLSAAEQQSANEIVLQHEMDDALHACWIAGAQDCIEKLRAKQIPVAIVTRNSKKATKLKLNKNNLHVDIVLTREDAAPKPDPCALLLIAKSWQMSVQHLVYIGDYLYDVQAANNAGMFAGLYTPNSQPDYAHLADWQFSHFEQLHTLINQ